MSTGWATQFEAAGADRRYSVSVGKLRYRVLLEAERESGFHAYMPELPGVHTFGRSREEALKQVEDAARLYLEDLRAGGEDPPQPAEETHISLSA